MAILWVEVGRIEGVGQGDFSAGYRRGSHQLSIERESDEFKGYDYAWKRQNNCGMLRVEFVEGRLCLRQRPNQQA